MKISIFNNKCKFDKNDLSCILGEHKRVQITRPFENGRDGLLSGEMYKSSKILVKFKCIICGIDL